MDWPLEPHLGSPPRVRDFTLRPSQSRHNEDAALGDIKPSKTGALERNFVPSSDHAGLRSAIGGSIGHLLPRLAIDGIYPNILRGRARRVPMLESDEFPSGEKLGISSPPASCGRGMMRGGAEGERVIQNRTASAAIAIAAVADAISIKVRGRGRSGFSIVGDGSRLGAAFIAKRAA